MSTRLLLIRHGETVDNVNKIMQGQTPGKLTPNGVEQARELAMRLKQEHIDAFVSSDLKRAVDTCVEIATPHFDGDRAKALDSIMQTPLLRERDWGSFTGRFIPDLKDVKWTDDIETTDVMRKRARHSSTLCAADMRERLWRLWGMASSTRSFSRYSSTSPCRMCRAWRMRK